MGRLGPRPTPLRKSTSKHDCHHHCIGMVTMALPWPCKVLMPILCGGGDAFQRQSLLAHSLASIFDEMAMAWPHTLTKVRGHVTFTVHTNPEVIQFQCRTVAEYIPLPTLLETGYGVTNEIYTTVGWVRASLDQTHGICDGHM